MERTYGSSKFMLKLLQREEENKMAKKKTALESTFQTDLITELRDRFVGCVILKNDANYVQGVPDLIILYGDKWAMLEVKRSSKYTLQPNQEYYVSQLNRMSFSAIIFPENAEYILNQMEQRWGLIGNTRVLRPLG